MCHEPSAEAACRHPIAWNFPEAPCEICIVDADVEFTFSNQLPDNRYFSERSVGPAACKRYVHASNSPVGSLAALEFDRQFLLVGHDGMVMLSPWGLLRLDQNVVLHPLNVFSFAADVMKLSAGAIDPVVQLFRLCGLYDDSLIATLSREASSPFQTDFGIVEHSRVKKDAFVYTAAPDTFSDCPDPGAILADLFMLPPPPPPPPSVASQSSSSEREGSDTSEDDLASWMSDVDEDAEEPHFGGNDVVIGASTLVSISLRIEEIRGDEDTEGSGVVGQIMA